MRAGGSTENPRRYNGLPQGKRSWYPSSIGLGVLITPWYSKPVAPSRSGGRHLGPHLGPHTDSAKVGNTYVALLHVKIHNSSTPFSVCERVGARMCMCGRVGVRFALPAHLLLAKVTPVRCLKHV